MVKQFAPEFPRNEHGWVKFPSDVGFRKELFFPEEVGKHPAKLNLHLQLAMIDYVSEPGQVLLDPTSGTGSLLVGALKGRRVVLLEIEEGYHKLQQQAMHNLHEVDPTTQGMVTLIHGDCRFVLPITCNHIMFSPPYAGAMNIKKVRTKREDAPDDFLVEMDVQMFEYSKNQRNLSKLSTFLYNKAMEKIYKLCFESLRPGGTLTIVIKDRIEGGERLYLSKWVTKVCHRIGFEDYAWFKWECMGNAFTKIARSQGKETVDDEDIIIYRRPI
ncbi:hypothetical protein LCGC14_0316440 [marine sediment metagenome]|uniref:DNA methylase N-4/N-6 domain-containing protein n=1 Tax=marine sediment metagenome TaxID=412755 RepID=A0A0F9U344_9ZZZZ